MLRTEGALKHGVSWRDLPPAQAGLAAALRRAFALPAEECELKLEELLSKID